MSADNFHQFGMTPEILVGNVVADALAKQGASVIPAVNDGGKMDRITWAVQQSIYATSILAAQAAPRNTTAHPEDVLFAARRVRKRERTSLENASSHSLVSVGNGYHCHVCELSTPAGGALDWLRNTICSGPPNSHPAMPVRIEHQTHQLSFHGGVYWCALCGQIAQHAAGKKSRAIGLVNECPRHLTRAGRDELARIERRRSPKASADWPLMRETIFSQQRLSCLLARQIFQWSSLLGHDPSVFVVVSLAGSSPFSMVWSSLLEYELLCAQFIRSGGVGTRCSGIPLSFLDCVFLGFGRFAFGTRVEIFACLFADVAHSALLSLPFSCAHSCQVCQVRWCDFLAGNGRFYCVAIPWLFVHWLLARGIQWVCNTGKLFSMVPWSSFRNHGNSRFWNGRSCGALSAVILGLMCAPLMLWWHLETMQ